MNIFIEMYHCNSQNVKFRRCVGGMQRSQSTVIRNKYMILLHIILLHATLVRQMGIDRIVKCKVAALITSAARSDRVVARCY